MWDVRAQRGAQTVEIALTFATFIVILVGIVELIRVLWTWSLLGEATRRGARVAAVCDLNDPAIYRAATELPGSGLAHGNIAVTYRYCVRVDPLNSGCEGFSTASWGSDQTPDAQIAAAIHAASPIWVEIAIQNYQPTFAFLFPWDDRNEDGLAVLNPTNAFLQRFTTTQPAESLGWNPSGGADGRGAFEPCS